MGFLGVYTALYDYQPQGENELEIQEGELLYLLEKGEDGWWKAKKKAADDEDDEPVGLIPANYVEKVCVSNIPCLFLSFFQSYDRFQPPSLLIAI